MQVDALIRHPIKSHGRERIDEVVLTEGQTMPWDRHWAITHDVTKFDPSRPAWAHCRNFMRGARTPGLVGIGARFDPRTRRITLSHSDLEDISFCPDDPRDAAAFLDWVTPLCPPDRAVPTGIVSVPGRGMTDSDFPSLSIMTMASHDAVAAEMETDISRDRWRGNIWLTGAAPWAEMGWIDRDIRIGEAVLRVRDTIRRCEVTNTSPVTGRRDAPTLDVLKTRFGHQFFGVYAEVTRTGRVATGDMAELL